jgi:hypothetical protein
MYRKVIAAAQFDWDCGLAELVLLKLCFIVVLKICCDLKLIAELKDFALSLTPA